MARVLSRSIFLSDGEISSFLPLHLMLINHLADVQNMRKERA